MFNRVSVWLDEYAPDAGAFADASDWAARLHIPLHAVADAVARDAADPLPPRVLEACGVACARKGVSWDTDFLIGSPDKVRGFFRDSELSAFGAALPEEVRHRLVSESLRNPSAPVMVCSGVWRPGARTLILHQGYGSGIGFLKRVVPLCRTLATPPVVLTIARTERQAVERQGLAREVFHNQRLEVDFDLIAGCHVRTGVAWAAQARGCSRVIVERENCSPWRRWLRGDPTWSLLGLAHKLSIVALPGDTSDGASSSPESGSH